MTLSPVNVQTIGNELAVVWSDGAESYIPLEKLRRSCPCASCGGEPDVMGNIDVPKVTYSDKSFLLRSTAQVGGYALQMTWQDGHDSGLFTYPYLRKLGGS